AALRRVAVVRRDSCTDGAGLGAGAFQRVHAHRVVRVVPRAPARARVGEPLTPPIPRSSRAPPRPQTAAVDADDARSTVVDGAGPAIEGRRRGRDEGASYTSSLVNPDRRPGTAVRDVAEPVEGDRTGLQTETTAAAAPRRRLRLPTGVRSRPLLIGAGLLALLALPLIVALAVLAQKRWYPILDLAMTEIRVRDVASSHPPLI